MIVPFPPHNSTNSAASSGFGANYHLIKNLLSIPSNFLFDRTGLSPTYVVSINFPLRLWSSIRAFKEERYWQIIFDVVSFASLFFSANKLSIAIDASSLLVDTCFQFRVCDFRVIQKIRKFGEALLSENSQTTVQEKTYLPHEKLGLSLEESKDPDRVNKAYNELSACWEKRIKNPNTTPFLRQSFEKELNSLQDAYQELISRK